MTPDALPRRPKPAATRGGDGPYASLSGFPVRCSSDTPGLERLAYREPPPQPRNVEPRDTVPEGRNTQENEEPAPRYEAKSYRRRACAKPDRGEQRACDADGTR